VESVSELHLVFVLQNVEPLPIFLSPRSLLQLQLKQSVGHHSDSDVDSFNIVFDLSNALLDLGQRAGIAEGLASIINLLLHIAQSFIDIHQLILHISHVLAHGLEVVLNISEMFSVSSVVSSHPLEAL